MRPDKLGIELAGMHGDTAVLTHGGRPELATVAPNKARASFLRWR
jgi:hypothetical protein